MGNLASFFCCLLIFFKINFLKKLFQEFLLECQTVWAQCFVWPDQNVGPDLVPNCLQRLSADNTSRQRVLKRNKQGFFGNFEKGP